MPGTSHMQGVVAYLRILSCLSTSALPSIRIIAYSATTLNDLSLSPEFPMDDVFEYTPLQDSSTETRLITLLPKSDEDDIVHCEISHVEFEVLPAFEALSYTWGSPET
jgi:hypothetical protein